MGCCASAPEEPEGQEMASVDDVKAEIKQQAAEDGAAGKTSFLGSIVMAVEKHPEDAQVLLDGAECSPLSHRPLVGSPRRLHFPPRPATLRILIAVG